MTDYSQLVIEPLAIPHAKAGFHCGVPALDDYIQRQARQDVTRRISRVFVATTVQQPDVLVGYYTLSTLSIELGQLPSAVARKLPRHPIPAALLGRLATDQNARG